MTTEIIIEHILPEYPEHFRTDRVRPLMLPSSLGNCQYWQIDAPAGLFCLRRWPKSGVKEERLQFLQAVLWHAVCEGIEFVPLALETLKNKGFIQYDRYYWELLPWVDDDCYTENDFFVPCHFPVIEFGTEQNSAVDTDDLHAIGNESTFSERGAFRTTSAMMSLAQFHLAVSCFPLPNQPVALSMEIHRSLIVWEKWISCRFAEIFPILRETESRSTSSEEILFVRSGLNFLETAMSLAGSCMILLTRASRFAVPIQPVIGNVCRRHLRFDEDGLCGILDLTEIGIDNVTLDIAKMLGSLAGSDASLWNLGLKAYQILRPLDDQELFMIQAFDWTQILLEGLGYLFDFFLGERKATPCQIVEMTRRIDVWNERLIREKRNRKIA